MLKFFRKYNKWILVVGASVLMVVFLLPSGGKWLMPSPIDQPVGEVDGRTITLGEQRRAVSELRVLGVIGQRTAGLEGLFTSLSGLDDPLAYVLALHEAKKLGLSASQNEVRDLLEQGLRLDNDGYKRLLASTGLNLGTIDQTLTHWLMIQRYRELVLGLGHLSPVDRVNRIAGAVQFMVKYGRMLPRPDLVLQYQLLTALGTPRFSEPLAQHLISSRLSEATVAFVTIPASRYVNRVDPQRITPTLLQELFDTYRDVLPGKGLPTDQRLKDEVRAESPTTTESVRKTYPFGYRTPDRVKLEYLSISFGQLRAKVDVDFAQAMAYYNEHPGEFLVEPPASSDPGDKAKAQDAAPKVKPFDAVRDQIMDRLRDRKAIELGKRMIQHARAMLMDEARPFAEHHGYKELADDWTPTPLSKVAQMLEKEFSLPVRTRRMDNEWFDRTKLAGLPGIGGAALITDDPRQAPQPLVSYVFSAKTFEPPANNPLSRLRLQAKLPSRALIGADNDIYMFRLIDAQKTRAPESLDEVREQVERDAGLVLAYRKLIEDKPRWLDRLKAETLESIAAEIGRTVGHPPPFAKGSSLRPPNVEGIGASRSFVDAVFELARKFGSSASLKAAPHDQRSTAVDLDHRLELALVRVDDYKPISRSAYRESVASPAWATEIYTELMAEQLAENPLSLDELVRRSGFKWDKRREGSDEKQAQKQVKK